MIIKISRTPTVFLDIFLVGRGMDANIRESLEPSSIKYKYDDGNNSNNHHIEPQELLEECWFFRNLLDRKTRILRSFSDPCSSSNFSQEIFPAKSYHQMSESIEKQPSMPPCMERKDQKNPITEGTICTEDPPPRNKCNWKTSSNNLFRGPSLPNSFGTQEFQDEEDNEFSMGKLIRQASMNSLERKHAAKCVTKSNRIISRNRSRMKPELKDIKLEGLEDARNQSLMNQFKNQRNLKNIELPKECLQGFQDMGFNFDKKDTNPNVISSTVSEGLPEKFKEDEERSSSTSSSSSVPIWGGIEKKKSTEDMKEQIKFWAKAVASNVR